MKTKEELIKEAYGIYWDKLFKYVKKTVLDNDGWLDFYELTTQSQLNVYNECRHLDIFHFDYDNDQIRPKSLQGIENNNGWIKIESEEDLPKDSWSYWVFRNDNLITTLRDYVGDKNNLEDEINITHYQPIIKPKPPLY